jgi:hypothetical protein
MGPGIEAAHRLSRIGVVTAALAAGACSLILNWDPDGLPCGTSKECASGYSCMVNSCVADGTIPLGETCSEDQQCEGEPDVTCGSNPFTCRERCEALLETTTTCGSTQYCRPELNTGATNQATGTCVDSECTNDDDCSLSAGLTCVPVTETARACLQQCEYSFATGTYTDRCTPTSGGQVQYCQSIGPSGHISFVCLDLADGLSRQFEGGVCDPVTNPCDVGLICHQTRCYWLCEGDGSGQCNIGTTQQVCLPLPGDGTARICDPLPNP